MSEATPEMVAAAWGAWQSRHGGKLGPGPGFVEAINAALASAPDRNRLQNMHRRAQKSEGEAMKMNAAYCCALWYAHREPSLFNYMLGYMLRHMSPFRHMKPSAPGSSSSPVDKSNSGETV